MSTSVSPSGSGPAPQGSLAHGASHAVTPNEIAVGVIIGRLGEFFDFFVYGLASVLVFPAVFFPFATPLDGLRYSFIIFSFGFIARPIGSLIFRVIHDWYGRGAKLTIALFLLGTSTVTMAFLPGYADIGRTAIVLLAVLRVTQGLAVGGSWDGMPSLLAVTCPRNRRGWYAMIAQIGAPIGFLMATGLFAYLVASLSAADFHDWGWRYPFFVAFAINVVALFARVRMVMTPEISELLKAKGLVPSPIGELFRLQGANIALGALAPLAAYALFHLVTVFPLSWVVLNPDFSLLTFLMVQVLGAGVCIVTMLISGMLADRTGRRRTLTAGAIMIGAFSALTPFLLNGSVEGSYAFILIGFGLLGFSHAQAAGAVNVRFASRFRYSGALVTSDFGWLLGAGFAPLVALFLSSHFGLGFIALYLLSGAAGTLLALRIDRHTQDIE